jgi:seryl-tRNA synthetase
MLDISFIRQNPEKVKKAVESRNVDPKLVDDFLVIDEKWRNRKKEIDEKRAQQNKFEKEKNIEEARKIKEEIKKLEEILEKIEKERQIILYQFPNIPQEDVKIGKDEKENEVLREIGEKSKFDFQPKDYLNIAEKLDLIDTERAAKVSGTRFGYIKGDLARLEFAIVNYVFSFLRNYDFRAVVPPVIIKTEMMKGMGYFDTEKDKEERYILEKDDMVLVGTAEQSIGPMHAGEIFEEEELPKRYVAFSSCFRREAGSYGKDTKGILRVHQFDKIEMFDFCQPEKSQEEHRLLLNLVETMMQEIKIPYRVVRLCTGDLAKPSAITYDIESWLPGQNNGTGEYRETHSISNVTDFQARRLNIKYKPKVKGLNLKTNEYVHMLNGTAFAIGRILIAIIENYQTKNGTIKIPEVLQKYIGIDEIK